MPFNKQPIQNFIGNGITLPLELVSGRPPLKTGFDLIKSSIKMILDWSFGSRPFLSEFGSRLNELLEEPNDDILQNVAQVFVKDAISTWEKRIELISADISRNNDTTLSITLVYRVVNSNVVDSYIYPFYSKIIY